MEVPSPYYQKVHMTVMNPKAVTIGELYGEVNPATNEWHDGLLGVIIRRACAVIIMIIPTKTYKKKIYIL